jgi:malate synthase
MTTTQAHIAEIPERGRHTALPGINVLATHSPGQDEILTPHALAFLAHLQREFNARRIALLQRRAERQEQLDAGQSFNFLPETTAVRDADWHVAPAPPDLEDRRVEITGPTDRKMMINALNSGAKVFMADFEDALSPTWDNVIQGQRNAIDAIRRRIEYTVPDGGKTYQLNASVATLLVRPRGWHLPEKHIQIDGQPMSASLFDFGLYFFHNARELLTRGSGPYFYLAKLESHLEAGLWNDVFNLAQDLLSIPRGTIRATVLIETISAAYEMDEILYVLREHASGLNAGRWDYIFSIIKKFRSRSDAMLPDRAQVTMTVPFMRAYTDLLVKTCHRRGAHALGGMAAFIPSRRDAEVNERALSKVREDKLRESGDGFDGTWVAHPDLVPTARDVFDHALGELPHQKERLRPEVSIAARQLSDINVPGGQVTESGLRSNVRIAIQYLDAWLTGNGAAAIDNLMEDTATAEISRAQVWQWLHHRAQLADGQHVTPELYHQVRSDELARLGDNHGGRAAEAAALLDSLVLDPNFVEFLTLIAYHRLTQS